MRRLSSPIGPLERELHRTTTTNPAMSLLDTVKAVADTARDKISNILPAEYG
jgi:hypothetical protein